MREGYYFLWSGLGAIEEIDDAEPLTATPKKAVDLLRQKKSGHWTLWLRQGLRAVLVATWIRGELTLIPIDCAELDGEPLPEVDREPLCKCARCGKQLYMGSCGNFQVANGAWEGICYACLKPEED